MIFFSSNIVTKSITLTQDAEKVLDKRLRQDANFNFSGWIRDKLLNEDNEKDVLQSQESIDIEIESVKADINYKLKKIESLISKKLELKTKMELQASEVELRAQREIEKKEYKKKIVNDFFKSEIGRELTEEELKEYFDCLDNEKVNSIFDYIAKKNIKKEVVMNERLS